MDFRTQCRVWTFMVCLLVTALVRAATADSAAPLVKFHIEGGDATTTLTEFSRQARLQLLFDYNVVKGHTTKPLDGILQPAEALRRLLANSDLDFDFVNERTLAVMQKRIPAESDPSTTEPKPAKRSPGRSKTNRIAADAAGDAVEVVRITGTYIRDKIPVGQEIISASREDIEATGAATPADFLSTLPQTFGGGPNQDTYIGQEAQTNSGFGVGENLRGLGARATLVLIDGRRVAPSGTEGEFVDIENIPLSAIERIDILPDSASATYGADAVGGVVNFILRQKFEGAETIARGGSGTRGDLQEYLLSQTLGKAWDGGNGLVSFEFYSRGALPAADRAYAVSDLRPYGGGNFDTNLTNPGNIINPVTGQTWAIPTGQNGMRLATTDLAAGTQNLQSLYSDGDQIIPSQQRWSLYTNVRQALGDRVGVFTNLLLAHRDAAETLSGEGATLVVPPTNPFYVNPTGLPGPVLVNYNFGKDLGPIRGSVGVDTLNATLGLDFNPGASWHISAYGSFVREKQNYVGHNYVDLTAAELALADPNPATALNPFGDGSFTNPATLQRIRTGNRIWLDSQLQTADLVADGPIAELPGGPLKLALGVDRRNQFFTMSQTTISPTPPTNANLSRRVLSAFGEFIAPVVSDGNEVPGIAHLEVSAAARYEDYSMFGSATTPKVGVLWSPTKTLSLRGTWSRAIRPPTLSDLDTSHNQSVSVPLPNPAAPGGATPTLIWEGGNATVQPERARSWTGGLDFAPAGLPGLTLGLTYFNTVFTHRIQSNTLTFNILTDPAYAALVTRNPSAAEISFICTHSSYFQGSTAACMNSAPGAIVDLRVLNLATLQTDGIDFNSRYQHSLPLGQLRLDLNGTWLLHFKQAQTPDAPLTSLLSTQNEPIDLRMRATAGWGVAGFHAQVAANFANGYHDIASTPPRRIDSWTTIDLQLRYDIPVTSSRWLSGTRIELNARNVFNVDPPFLDNQIVGIGYDQENANPYGRQLSLELRKSW
jgi:outer membrane receptor protein involved in Fe transport